MKKLLSVSFILSLLLSSLCLYSCEQSDVNKKETGKTSTTREISEAKDDITDTFVVGDSIEIALTETTTEFIVEPGAVIGKDTKVVVKNNGDGCWLYIKCESTLPEYINYEIDGLWTSLDGFEGVYYIENPDVNEYSVLANEQVTVDADITDVSETEGAVISFTAYAIDIDSSDDPVEAYLDLLEELS